jgi:hypothetical protein
MSKTNTKELFNEVKKQIEKKEGFEVFGGYSDFGNKSSIIKRNPNCSLKENQIVKDEVKYFSICEFSVYKSLHKENFIIWDYRENQPNNKSKNWVNPKLAFDLPFSRYEFDNIDDFYNHVISDFGLTTFDKMRVERTSQLLSF